MESECQVVKDLEKPDRSWQRYWVCGRKLGHMAQNWATTRNQRLNFPDSIGEMQFGNRGDGAACLS